MNPDVAFTLFILTLGFAGSTIGFFVAWRGAARRARRLEDALRELKGNDDRLARLEAAIEGLDGDFSKLQEEQDFFSRLLTTRRQSQGRSTPH